MTGVFLAFNAIHILLRAFQRYLMSSNLDSAASSASRHARLINNVRRRALPSGDDEIITLIASSPKQRQ